EEKKDDDEDDKSIDIEKTDDDEETDDEFVHGDEYVHDDVDKEMKDAEDAETGKDDEEITDAEKTEVTKGELEQAIKLPLISSSLSVSSGFGNQFLNLSSDTSLIGTIKESADTEINSLLDIQIQQEVPHIQSPSILIVPVLVIPDPTVLSPIPEIPTVTLATTLSPPSFVTTITPVLQQTITPIPTLPITTVAPVATTVPNPLPAIAQRVYVLEKDVQELKQVDHSAKILAPIKSQIPSAVNKYLGSSLRDALQKIKQEQATKEKMQKLSATPYDQAAKEEFKQKEILFKMTTESKSYEKHPKHKALYDVLVLSLIQDEDDLDRVIPDLRKRVREEDEDPSAGSNQGKRKRRLGKDSEPSKTSSASKETSKGDTLLKYSKIGKYASVKESVKEANFEVTMGEEEPVQENVNDADQPQANPEQQIDNAPKKNWFKQPPRPPTLDLEWNKCQVIDDQLKQTWFNDMMSATKDPLTFDELMATPINFSNFAKNRLKLDKITKANLVGSVYNLLNGTCQSSIELEYNREECFKALTGKTLKVTDTHLT
ncbi:hypothetical protein Tco_1471091, partial [Tanacetum coccineum]